jgi:hypothetical protein
MEGKQIGKWGVFTSLREAPKSSIKDGKRLQELKQQHPVVTYQRRSIEKRIERINFAIKSKTRSSKEGAMFWFESQTKLEFIFSVQLEDNTVFWNNK